MILIYLSSETFN